MEGKPKRTRVPKPMLYSVTIPDARRSALQHGYFKQLERLARLLRNRSPEINPEGKALIECGIRSYYRECVTVGFEGPAQLALEREGIKLIFTKSDDP